MGAPKGQAPPAVETHEDCPPPVWQGVDWQCMNHHPPQVVVKVREPLVAAGSVADLARRKETAAKGQQPHTGGEAVTGLARDVSALRSEVGSMEVAKLRAEVALLRRSVAEKETGAPLAELLSEFTNVLQGIAIGLTDGGAEASGLRAELVALDLPVAVAHVNELRSQVEQLRASEAALGLITARLDTFETTLANLGTAQGEAFGDVLNRLAALEADE